MTELEPTPRHESRGRHRYVIFGAGAVGATLAADLHLGGHEVVMVARGPHLARLTSRGLTVRTPEETLELRLPVVGSIRELELGPVDRVMLTVKSGDTSQALHELAGHADDGIALVCAQNGVENERLALRFFDRVYGMMLILHSVFVESGTIEVRNAPLWGIADLGRYPAGDDELVTGVSSDLSSFRVLSAANPRVMASKYRKLLLNLGNALEALVGKDAWTSPLVDQAQREALAVFEAAGIEVAPADEFEQRRQQIVGQVSIDETRPFQGGSTWQSLTRGSRTVETPYLNGEIVLLGRLHGLPTPVNEFITATTLAFAESGSPPGSLSLEWVHQAFEGRRPMPRPAHDSDPTRQ